MASCDLPAEACQAHETEAAAAEASVQITAWRAERQVLKGQLAKQVPCVDREKLEAVEPVLRRLAERAALRDRSRERQTMISAVTIPDDQKPLRGMVAVIAAAALLGLAGCTSGAAAGGPRHAGRPTRPEVHPAASRRPSPRILPDVSQCADPQSSVEIPNPSGPAYAGPGPHRVVVGAFDTPAADGLPHAGADEFSLPRSWVSFGSDHLLQDPSHAQLIVCLTAMRKTGTKAIGTCTYDSAEGEVYPVTYTFEVFEARTGRRVAQTTMPGDDTAAACPSEVEYVAGDPVVPIGQALKDETFQSWLRPFVLGPAR